MNAMSKSVKAFVVIAALSAGSAMAGQGGCMPMSMPMKMPMQMQMPMQMPMMQGASGCGGTEAAAQQACPLREARAEQDEGCGGNGQDMSSKIGSLAAGGMNIAMTVIGSIFGTPAK